MKGPGDRRWLPGLLGRLLLALVASTATLFLAECTYRRILFGGAPEFAGLRQARLYADYDSDDDFWKLCVLFGDEHRPPSNPHPLLGWVGEFSRDSFLHHRAGELQGRRPVLLYGDSFARRPDSPLQYEDLLNSDPAFAEHHSLLNYGVAGYGLDQVLLLLQSSVDQYSDPLVIVSLMTLDLDRCVLTVRPGPKPFFEVHDEALTLCGVPIGADIDAYLRDHPVSIRSYLYRRVLYSKRMPRALRELLRGEEEIIARKKQLGARILAEIVGALRRRDLDFFFVVFHPHQPGVSELQGETDWRDPFLRQTLAELEVSYLWSKDVYRSDNPDGRHGPERYIAEDGHPTEHFTRLLGREVSLRVRGE